MVWRCSCHKERGLSPRSHYALFHLLRLACKHFWIVRQFGRRWRLALGVNGAIFRLLGSRLFSWAPWKLYRRVAFCDCCEVGGKWFSRAKVMTSRFLVCE
jgi:hypothetical protein